MPTTKRTRPRPEMIDWERVDRTTDEEIDAQMAADPDTAPIFTDEELANARLVPSSPPPRT